MAYTKIGIHYMDGNDRGEGYNRAAAPTVVKLVNAFSDADKIAALPHKPMIIGRLADRKDDWWEKYTPREATDNTIDSLRPHILKNPAIEYWETINEPVISADLSESMQRGLMYWLDEYQELCAYKLQELGKKLVAFNFSVGNPHRHLWKYAKRTLAMTKTHGVVIGLHRYLELIRVGDAPDISGTVNNFWGKYHLLDLEDFAKLGYSPKVVITECGLEFLGNGKAWKAENIPASVYAHILHEWDLVLQQSPQVIGATVFTCGGIGWDNHNIANSDVMTHLTRWAQTQSAPTPKPPVVTPPPPSEHEFTNQDMFNLVFRITKKPIGMVIPADVLATMTNRQAKYTGAPPRTWGATPEQLAAIEKGMI